MLDTEAWRNPAIARGVGERFVPARVIDRQREDGRNSPNIDELHRRYNVQAFPTLIVADAAGREISRMEGYAGRERLEAFLADAVRKAGER
jgi:protein-disulfide isomerase-like protein with CxxC motif